MGIRRLSAGLVTVVVFASSLIPAASEANELAWQWREVAAFQLPQVSTADYGGGSAAIDGDRAAVSKTQLFGQNEDAGVVAFARSDGIWRQDQILLSPDGAQTGWSDKFGKALGLSGDLLLVGAPGDDDGSSSGPTFVGKAYLYRHDGSHWRIDQIFSPGPGSHWGRFGESVDVEGSWLIVGAPGEQREVDPDAAGPVHEGGPGVAYVFKRVGDEWVLDNRIAAPEGVDDFGMHVAISEGHALIASSTMAWIYERSGDGAWQVAWSHPSVAGVTSPVAIDGDTALIHAAGSSAVLVVENGEDGWRAVKALPNEGGSSGDVGAALAVSGDRIALGDPFIPSGGPALGRVLTYIRKDGVWTFDATVSSPTGYLFGAALDLSGDQMLVSEIDFPTGGEGVAHFYEPAPKADFVYLAFGDSYQSGEGAGAELLQVDYLRVYENGSNYPGAVGSQTNTYTPPLGGDGCHRALENYAKINRDRFEPGASVLLIDRTCSGARIEPSSKPPIVGWSTGSAYSAGSQVDEAVRILEEMGLSPEDVDLVTVGMGGNDAAFGEIVQSCLAPTVVADLLRRWDETPRLLSTAESFINNCAFYNRNNDAVDTLQEKVEWAQSVLLEIFPNARILQLDYPDILPADPQDSPSWCGGIDSRNVPFAKGKVDDINGAIRKAIEKTESDRLQLVEVENGFYSRDGWWLFKRDSGNPLCDEVPLANGVNQARYEAELDRLFADQEIQRRLSQLRDTYDRYWTCAFECPWRTDGAQRLDDLAQSLKTQVDELVAYAISGLPDMVVRIVSPVPSESIHLAKDRATGLFHPSTAGISVLSCHVLGQYSGAEFGDRRAECLQSTKRRPLMVDGYTPGFGPREVQAGEALQVEAGGFAPASEVVVVMASDPVEIGRFTADDLGDVFGSLVLPSATPGVHTITMDGVSRTGAGIGYEFRVAYPGRPILGDAMGVYFCCASMPIDVDEALEARRTPATLWLGETPIAEHTLDAGGGLFLELIMVDTDEQGGYRVTYGETELHPTATIDPLPAPIGVWSIGPDPMRVVGSGHVFDVPVVGLADVAVRGTDHSFDVGLVHGGVLDVKGTGHVVDAQLWAEDPLPPIVGIAEYRPGGSRAGTDYVQLSGTSCGRHGIRLEAGDLPETGVVYAPCNVTISGSVESTALTIVADGAIVVSGNSTEWQPYSAGWPTILASSDVRLSGSDQSLGGSVISLFGDVSVTGSRNVVSCFVYGEAVSISGIRNSFHYETDCHG